MKLTEITISGARTFNLGNFENIKLVANASASVEDGDDPTEVRERIVEEVRLALAAAYARLHPEGRRRAAEANNGDAHA